MYSYAARIGRTVFFLLLGLSFLTQGSVWAAPPDPTEQIRPFLDKVLKTLGRSDFKAMSREQQGDHLLKLVKERFDFRETGRRVLGQQWNSMNADQQKHFVDLFTRFLKDIYIDKIDEYSGQEILFVGQRIQGQRAEVRTVLKDKQNSITVNYIVQLSGNTWMIYDVVAEGISLVRNYGEQFREILRKDGYDGLIKQIEAKIQEVEKK